MRVFFRKINVVGALVSVLVVASPAPASEQRTLSGYVTMVSESGDYFETCGELTIAVEDHETFTRWFDAMRPWCRATRALDGLIWQLCEGDWSAK